MLCLINGVDAPVDYPPWCACSLDYPGIGPEHSFLKDVGRAEYYAVTDAEALEAFQRLSQLEGIIPALETSHAIAYLEVRSDRAIQMYEYVTAHGDWSMYMPLLHMYVLHLC